MGKRRKTGLEKHWAQRHGFSKACAKVFKTARLPPPPPKQESEDEEDGEDGGEAAAKKKKKKIQGRVPYKANQRILLVGEGNLSFAAALSTVLGTADGVTATCFDDESTVTEKYPDAVTNAETVADHAGKVLYGIDATNLEDCAKELDPPYDHVVFNFPHAGAGIKDQALNIECNQRLVQAYIKSAFNVVHSQGEVHVTTKGGEPYNSWRVAKLGVSLEGVKLKNALPFDPALYPEYRHRRTIGYEEGLSTTENEDIGEGCRTFVFKKGQQKVAEDDEVKHNPSKKRKVKGGKSKGSGKEKGLGPRGAKKLRKGKRERNKSLALHV